MPRDKVKFSLIKYPSKRRLTYQYRSKSFVKKCEELSTLCGVKVCSILTSGTHIAQANPMGWASPPGMQGVFDCYDEVKHTGKWRKEMDQASFLHERLTKVKDKVKTQQALNKDRKITDLMLGYLDRGRNNRVQELFYLPSSNINDLYQKVGKILSKMDNKVMNENLYQSLPPPTPIAQGGEAVVAFEKSMMGLSPVFDDVNDYVTFDGPPQINNSLGPNNP